MLITVLHLWDNGKNFYFALEIISNTLMLKVWHSFQNHTFFFLLKIEFPVENMGSAEKRRKNLNESTKGNKIAFQFLWYLVSASLKSRSFLWKTHLNTDRNPVYMVKALGLCAWCFHLLSTRFTHDSCGLAHTEGWHQCFSGITWRPLCHTPVPLSSMYTAICSMLENLPMWIPQCYLQFVFLYLSLPRFLLFRL